MLPFDIAPHDDNVIDAMWQFNSDPPLSIQVYRLTGNSIYLSIYLLIRTSKGDL